MSVITPIVSVCITAFNIERYIGRAINSVLSQKTTFEFEIVIGEDKSIDNTPKILRDYETKYPGKIKVIVNNYNLGMMHNFIKTIEACTGKYIAILDGDDFWIDSAKLQKQYDFLENNPTYSLCWHDAIIVNSDEMVISSYSERFKGRNYEQDFDLFTVIRWKVLGATSSIFFRNTISPFPAWSYSLYGTEALLFLRCRLVGSLHYITEKMSAYRVHDGSMESTFNKITKAKRNINEERVLSKALFPLYQEHFLKKIAWNTFYLAALNLKEFKIFESIDYLLSYIVILPKYAFYKIKNFKLV